MTMDDLGNLLRQTFREKEHEAPDAAPLVARVRAASATRRVKGNRLFVVSVAACAVAAVAVATTVLTLGGGSEVGAGLIDGRPHDQVVDGMRAWSSRGLQVRVPESWPVNALHCGEPTKPTVIVDLGPIETCAVSPGPGYDTVEFKSAQGQAAAPDNPPFYPNVPTMHPVEVDGKQAQIGSMRLPNGQTLEVLIIPGLDVAVGATTKDPALAQRIIASAHVVDVDANGCPSQTARVEPGKPSREGANRVLVPGAPIAASVCHYGHANWPAYASGTGPLPLAHSQQVAPEQLDAFVSSFNALRHGLRSRPTIQGACAQADREGYVARFYYQSGPPLDVYVHFMSCNHLGADNGADTGTLTDAFENAFGPYFPSFAAAGSS